MAGEGFAWDDLRLFLAAWRTGSLTSAARELGVNQSTASRRLSTLEDRLGARLFDRVPGGLQPTALASAVLAHAEAAESAVTAFSGVVEGVDTRLVGTVRVAVPDAVDSLLLAPLVPELRATHPGLVLELVASASIANLARREADLALRFVRPSGDLVCRRAARMTSSVWATAAHARASVAEAPWIVWDDGLDALEAAWMARHVPPERAVLRVNRTEAKLAAARAGLGQTVLPDVIGREFPDLVRVEAPPLEPCDVWLVAHPALRDVPRVAAVWEFLLDAAERRLRA